MGSLGLRRPLELWLFYWSKALMSFSYFAPFNVLVLDFTEDFNLADSAAGWVSVAHGCIKGFVCVCGAVATDKNGCGNAQTIGCALLAFGYGGIANMTSFQHVVTAIMTVEPIGPRCMDENNATLQQRQAANSMDIMRDVLMRRRF